MIRGSPHACDVSWAPVRTLNVMQTELEGISEQLRIPGSKALGPVSKVR